MLRRVATFCRPLRPVLLLVSFPRSRSPVVGVLGLCWMWRGVPFACQRRPIIGVLRMCWLLPGSFDCFCCPRASVHRPSIACLAVFLCGPGALFLHALSGPSTPPPRGGPFAVRQSWRVAVAVVPCVRRRSPDDTVGLHRPLRCGRPQSNGRTPASAAPIDMSYDTRPTPPVMTGGLRASAATAGAAARGSGASSPRRHALCGTPQHPPSGSTAASGCGARGPARGPRRRSR